MGKDVIIALDFPDAARTYEFLGRFDGRNRRPFVKISIVF